MKNTRQYGVQATYYGLTSASFSLFSEVSLKYSEDRVNAQKGLQVLLYTPIDFELPSKNNRLGFLKPVGIFPAYNRDAESVQFADWLQLRHCNNLGIEFINYEDLVLFNASFSLELYPLSGFLNRVFGQYNILQLRYEIVERVKLNDTQTSLFTGTSRLYGANLQYKINQSGKLPSPWVMNIMTEEIR